MTEPIFSLEESAERLGVEPDTLLTFINEHAAEWVAKGLAHYDEAGNLIIDGGEDEAS
jgi:hypothetical protein